jgi:hypothetical protein
MMDEYRCSRTDFLGVFDESSVEVLPRRLNTDSVDASDAGELVFHSLCKGGLTFGIDMAEGKPWRKTTVG